MLLKEIVMETNRASQQFGQRKTSQALKMAAVLLGVIVFSYLAGTLGRYPFSHWTAASPIVVEHAANGPVSEATDLNLTVPASPTSDSQAEKQGTSDLPRECDLRQGIDSACIFN